MNAVRALLALLPMAGSLAQGTFVVDIANGPGTNFTQIAAAVAAVPDGSILLVRAGNYAAVDIDGKGLSVLADAQVTVPTLQVRNTASNQRVVVRGLGTNFGGRVDVTSAAGLVLLDGVGSATWCTMRVAASDQVVVRNSTFQFYAGWPSFAAPAVEVAVHSRVVFESCQMLGKPGQVVGGPVGGSLWGPSSALAIGVDGTPCEVQITACSLTGGTGGVIGGGIWDPPSPYPGMSAIQLGGGSSLRACGQAAHTISTGASPTSNPDAIVGIGSARVHPAIPVTPAPAGSSPTLSFTRPDMASVVSTGGALGGLLTVERRGPSGVPFALAFSLPGAPMPWVTPPDPLWLDLPTVVLVALGIAPVGPFQVQLPLPVIPGLVGWTGLWQAVDFEPTGGLPLSNPSAFVLY